MKRGIALAAGLGLRLRPITLTTPKPLVEVAGKTLLDHALDKLADVGVEECVVNMHHLASKIASHVAARQTPRIQLSDETGELLETGGGIAKALPLLGDQPFFAANADILWTDGLGDMPALTRLKQAWESQRMDALLLLVPTQNAFGYEGAGDFFLQDDGRLQRRGKAASAPYVFAGVQVLHPRLFSDVPPGPFSLNLLYDRALADQRLYGLVHQGGWYHIGTPDALGEARRLLG
ncbi:MAG: nucleotidyltransferase family protein [Alphaproteobacteria bacterium]|nr:nucleotidyltransferase family protein [Alphaproteobacteria bacterium]